MELIGNVIVLLFYCLFLRLDLNLEVEIGQVVI